MSSRYIQRFPSPNLFNEIIHDFTKEVLRNQPDDIVEFGALYFKCLQEGVLLDYPKKGQNIPCDFKNVIPKKPVAKIDVQRTDFLEEHQKAVEQSELNKDKAGGSLGGAGGAGGAGGGAGGNKAAPKEGKEPIKKKDTTIKSNVEQSKETNKQIEIDVKQDKERTDPDPPKKDVSSNTLQKISGSFVDGIWGKQSIDIEGIIYFKYFYRRKK